MTRVVKVHEHVDTARQSSSALQAQKSAKPRTGDVDLRDIMPCMALFCCVWSFYFDLPDCLGVVCRNTTLCCHCEMLGCKTAKEEETYCKFFKANIDIIHFETCCESKAQAFCVDWRIAFPPTEEIPCMLTCCLITCCYQNHVLCKCATDVREIEETALGPNPGPYELDVKS